MNNQKNSVNSELKMTHIPLRTQIENLLFNDILEEINTKIRDELYAFLQVLPYNVFKKELASFLKKINQLAQEGLQNGSNLSRPTNCSKLVLTNSRPSSSFNCWKPSTISTISCNNNIIIRQPENNVQPIASINLSKAPVHIGLQSNKVVSPNINQLSYASQSSSKIVEINHDNNNIAETSETNDNREHLNLSEPIFNCSSSQKNIYSGTTTVVGNKSVSALHQNFELSDNIKATKSDTNENNGNLLKKYLSKWSINMKMDNCRKASVLLTGTLLEADKSTLKEKYHNAGIIISRKQKDLLETSNGLYRLVGNIISGSPDELYQECLSEKGFPLKWRIILDDCSCDDEKIQMEVLNFLGAPITSIKSMKKPQNHYISMTRPGKTNGHSILTNRKRKEPGDEVSDKSKTNYAKFNKKLPLLTSTSKISKKEYLVYETLTQNLKNVHRKINTIVLERIDDDSIYVTENGWSYIEEQAGKLSKGKSPVKTQELSSVSSTCLKQIERNVTVENINSLKNITQSTSKTSENSSATMICNTDKQLSSPELPKNFSKSSINQTPLSEIHVKALQQIKPVKAKSIENLKIVRPNMSIHELKKRKKSSLHANYHQC